tara:strand:+ start:134 stop:460 length:327 start_codon:yes stop_codon:yes gene_type:complete
MGPNLWEIMEETGWSETEQDRYCNRNGDTLPVDVSMPDWENDTWITAGRFDKWFYISISTLDPEDSIVYEVDEIFMTRDDPNEVLDKAVEEWDVSHGVYRALHKWMWG